MRRILMTALAAGPDGVLRPGTAVDVPEAQAAALISGGYAEDLAQPSAEAATAPAEETAAEAGAESATAPADESRA